MRLIAALSVLLVSASSGQVAINDLFNRPGPALGPDWTQQDGNANLVGNQLQAASPFTLGWSSHNAYGATYANTVVQARWAMNGFGGDSISVVAGVNPATWEGIEVRIADNNGDGLADRIFFNRAVNAGTWYGGSTFANLVSPLASGAVKIWFSANGDTVNVEVRDLATNGVETFARSGILSQPPVGTSVGIAYFGNGFVDDFQAYEGSPTGPTLTLTPPRIGSAPAFLTTGNTPSGSFILAYSVAGNGPLPSIYGNIGLTWPIEILDYLAPDAAGRAELVLAPLPASLLGVTVYLQGLDYPSLTLTNPFSATGF